MASFLRVSYRETRVSSLRLTACTIHWHYAAAVRVRPDVCARCVHAEIRTPIRTTCEFAVDIPERSLITMVDSSNTNGWQIAVQRSDVAIRVLIVAIVVLTHVQGFNSIFLFAFPAPATTGIPAAKALMTASSSDGRCPVPNDIFMTEPFQPRG